MIPHIYKECITPNDQLYGKGITYTKNLDSSFHCLDYDKNIENDIINRKYDLIIYGSYHRGMPYLELIKKYYKNNDIILLCGEDNHRCDHMKYVSQEHHTFVREL